MTDTEKERIATKATNLRLKARSIRSSLIPKLAQFKGEFKASEWEIVQMAINNYLLDIDNEVTRLDIITQQPFL